MELFVTFSTFSGRLTLSSRVPFNRGGISSEFCHYRTFSAAVRPLTCACLPAARGTSAFILSDGLKGDPEFRHTSWPDNVVTVPTLLFADFAWVFYPYLTDSFDDDSN